MPYTGQRATGESLISLEQSKIFEEFTATIKPHDKQESRKLDPVQLPLTDKEVTRILAIDGSIVSEKIKDGFPGAEASLVQIALVSIDLNKLNTELEKAIIPPSAFNEMDRAYTFQCVLPGCNVIKKDGTPPKDFFRESIYDSLQGSVQNGHETLMETYRALVQDRDNKFSCPNPDCENKIEAGTYKWICPCDKTIQLYETDPLRFHERFREFGSNGESHGEVMRFLELILLLNVLRYFVSSEEYVGILPTLAFVVDGPLAAFGQFAAVVPYVRKELKRINDICYQKTGKDILLFSLIKTGTFCEHFEELDFDEEKGPNLRYDPKTVLLPDTSYIHKYVVYRQEDAKPWGQDTYFGRMVLYKSKSGQRMVLNTPQISEESSDLYNTAPAAFPRLVDATKVVDRLSTYLFDGGFVPIVRAHSHAAIPLKMGGEIIKSLFENE